jgi:large subunit ribosomal protein L27
MAHKKAGGTAKNLRDSNPQYLGIKLYAGEKAQPGSIIVRQRGTRYLPGKNVRLGKDHTIYSVVDGTVDYGSKRKTSFNGKTVRKSVVDVHENTK